MNSQLRSFATSCFHQDWDEDVESTDDAVVEFRDSHRPETNAAVVQGLRQLLEDYVDDAHLQHQWLSELHAAYLPSYDDSTDLTLREWFEHVIALLESPVG